MSNMESENLNVCGDPKVAVSARNKNKLLEVGVVVLLVLLVVVTFFYIAPAFQGVGGGMAGAVKTDSTLLTNDVARSTMAKLKSEIAGLNKKLDTFLPHDPYIIVNTTKNQFHLYDRKGGLVREGFCSSGSYTKLVSEKKTWIFKTPRGRMTVLAKTENPVWGKPDWAFVEEGLPVPPAGDPSRFERGVLGAYKLTMADGYLLHGTLYKRFLGMPVTHGCIRLGDEDLEAVYHTLNVGSYVYIY